MQWLRLSFVLLTFALGARAEALRVVSQTVGTDEMLLALAEPAQIAALSHLARERTYSGVSAEAVAFPLLTPTGDAEGILKHRPTLVLFADYSRAELVAQVRRAGVRVFLLRNYATLDESLASLRELARELRPDAEARAEKIVTDCRARVAALEEKLRGRPRVRVIAPSTYGVIGGAGTTFQDLCDRAGAENLAVTLGHLVGHAQPPNERMLTWPIERVVLPGDNLDDALAPYLKLPPYQFMLAVRERRVAVIPSWQMSTVSHRRVDAYETLARALHPEVFAR